MNEIEFLKWIVGILGTGVIGVSGFATKVFISLIRADQQSREKNTIALTKLVASIDEFNRVNGDNQRRCSEIQMEYTKQIEKIGKF